MRPHDINTHSQGHLKVTRAKPLQKMLFCFPIANTLSVKSVSVTVQAQRQVETYIVI